MVCGATYVRPDFTFNGGAMTSTTVQSRFSGSGYYDNATAITNVRFLFASGNITSGVIKVRGYAA